MWRSTYKRFILPRIKWMLLLPPPSCRCITDWAHAWLNLCPCSGTVDCCLRWDAGSAASNERRDTRATPPPPGDEWRWVPLPPPAASLGSGLARRHHDPGATPLARRVYCLTSSSVAGTRRRLGSSSAHASLKLGTCLAQCSWQVTSPHAHTVAQRSPCSESHTL